MATQTLVKHIGMGHGVALYTSAILGAGVLVLPGQVASLAGPASLLSWAAACVVGVPLAAMFAALARRYPDAGGIATYARAAFGPTAGGLTGWLFFAAGSVGQTIVPLTGGYYVAHAFELGEPWALVVAAAILAAATVANLAGVRASARTQLTLAAAVAGALAVTILVAVPHMDTHRLTPFAPHGMAPVGAGVIILFFAFAGWEAIAHLAEEFHDPDRDVPRAVATTIVLISALYLGIASAVVLTGIHGSQDTDRVVIGLLLQQTFGPAAFAIAAVLAVVISLGTTNAFIAGVSRLGLSLAEEGWLPRPVARVTAGGVPLGGVLAVAAVALGGLALSAWRGWGTETLVVVPSTLVVAVYVVAAAAGARVLRGWGRVAAGVTLLLTLGVAPSAVGYVLVPVIVGGLALLSRMVSARSSLRPPGLGRARLAEDCGRRPRRDPSDP